MEKPGLMLGGVWPSEWVIGHAASLIPSLGFAVEDDSHQASAVVAEQG
jgi:hypothetical protein